MATLMTTAFPCLQALAAPLPIHPGSIQYDVTGGSPIASLSASSITFASVIVGTSSPTQTVTLHNTGTAGLNISSIAITGTGALFAPGAGPFPETSNCPSTLPMGDSCTITVGFNPAVAGGYVGAITVTDNASPPTQSVALRGTATLITAAAAARFLDQTSFGPTTATIAQVQQLGLTGALKQQFNTAAIPLSDIPIPYPTQCSGASYPCAESEWWQTILTGRDQFRQRVAFALSEIWVTSSATVPGEGMTPYMNILAKDAFTNYRTIMEDVTLSPAMGIYLNMLNSNKPGNGQIANENYSRELLQLFTVGLDLLNPDGTLQTDGSGNPKPTFTEADVQGLARAFTGWTFSNANGTAPTKFPNNTNAWDYPMGAVAANHDMGAKLILGKTMLPAVQSPQQDLAGSLDAIFNHPNVGPFVCKQLIQHLVSSNPSRAYVSRVAAVFANDGNGVRGDMKAVITAILMDPEARAADSDPTVEGGHLREPILYITDVLRGLGFTPTDPNAAADYAYASLSNYAGNLSERPMRSGSVFNFFPPSYVIPNTQLNAPEFGLENSASVILRLSLADSLVNNRISGFTVNLSATSPLGVIAASNPGQLVDTLAMMFMHSQMPANMRTAIVNHITTITNNPAERLRVAIYLILSASQYKIIH